jgi:hypothetical protein
MGNHDLMKALYDTQTQKLLPWPRIDEEPVVGLAAHLLEMTVTQEPQPAYDPATQRLDKTEIIDANARTVTRGWSVAEVPVATYSPEQWVSQHLSPLQVAALSEFRLALLQASKPLGSNMAGLKGWLEGMMAESVNSTPRTFQAPPCSYEDAASEAVAALQS